MCVFNKMNNVNERKRTRSNKKRSITQFNKTYKSKSNVQRYNSTLLLSNVNFIPSLTELYLMKEIYQREKLSDFGSIK